ncbi:pyridoxal phosphate-dependent aminotransferase [Hujiaoplasma nucleasis]|uniref:Aminotransferase n=1 Tax=Hujiaoplasma nucleasis TaxID=2725268 RepID=A0A7L6N8D8_9MOLU|nr:pyridoxal phosphate-dependent aminotransferase [Hujiaoplasma nucleasis]QLY40814.1 pyridoxal phosphate-dependent aminotransferase [Hujiaoplasma nucleasis]
MKLSDRILGMQESPVRKLVPVATKAKKRGIKVYHLNIGQPDIETPKCFMEAIEAYDSKVIKYSFSQGEPVLIDAIIDYYKRDGMHYEEDEVLITNGGSEALTFASIATCNPGDEILIPEPFYTNYNGFTSEVNVNLVPITTKAETGFHLPKKEEIVKLINEKTKAILFSNPGNPTGTILTLEEMEMIKEIAIEHDLFIISDEVYRKMAFDGLISHSMAELEGIEDRLILVDSVSKRFSACGARIGAIMSKNKLLMKNILKLCQARLCVATLEQIGAAALYSMPLDYADHIRDIYQKRRDIVYETLMQIPGVVCEKPQGAFYVVAKLPIEDAEDFCLWLLDSYDHEGETVMLAPAQGFYATEGLGKNEVRIAYVLKEEEMQRAMSILKEALLVYKQKS